MIKVGDLELFKMRNIIRDIQYELQCAKEKQLTDTDIQLIRNNLRRANRYMAQLRKELTILNKESGVKK